ncbi:phospholipid phosphatase 1-like [Tenebrio molitor]|jgi:phosphatidate phosphatase|uniref:phospholipid phosphatase 1-like n=1 Tax=Tenebrio molitor TaxID=7067 RepID=UPI0036249EE9
MYSIVCHRFIKILCIYAMQTYYRLLFLISLLFLLEYNVIPNTRFSFKCKDPKISYTFNGDTISGKDLLLSVYFGPFIILVLIEILKENSLKKINFGTVWIYYKRCFIGSMFVLLITEILKGVVKEPRPHFLDSCKPNSNEICQAGSLVFEYNCTNDHLSTFYKNDLTRSFPSGHTSISIFISLFCSYLIHIRIPSKSVRFLTKPFLIAICLSWSLLCSLSRITDRRHHWWDVLGGAALGICGALYTLHFLHKDVIKSTTCDVKKSQTEEVMK